MPIRAREDLSSTVNHVPFDVVQERIITKHVTNLQPDDSALRMSFPAAGKVRVHSFPVRYGDANGIQRPIEIGLRRGLNEWIEDRNTIQFHARDDGSIVYGVGGHLLRMRLASRLMYLPTVQAEDVAGAPVVTSPDGSRIQWAGVLGDEFEIEYTVSAGVVKETLTLPIMPDLGLAETYQLLWQFQANTLVPVLQEGSVLWQDDTQTTWLRFPAPTCLDAVRRRLRIEYRLAGDRLIVVVNADDLRAATYPVVIDPTATNQTTAECARTADSGPDEGALFFQFDLPDIGAGSTVTAASFFFRKVSSFGSHSQLVSSWTNSNIAWNSNSSDTILNALKTGGYNTDSLTMATTDADGTWYEFDVLGVVGTSTCIAYAYNASTNPGNWTIVIYDATDTIEESKLAAASINFPSENNESDAVVIDGPAAVTTTNRPYVIITYNTGSVTHTGVGAVTTGAMTAAGPVKREVPTTGAVTTGAMTCSGVVKREVPAVGAVTMGVMTCAGVGVHIIPAVGAVTMGAMTCSGVVFRQGDVTGGLTLGVMIVAGAVKREVFAVSAASIPGMTCSGAVKREIPTTGAVTTGAMTCAGVGVHIITATGALTLGGVTCVGSVKREVPAVGAVTLGAMTCSGTVVEIWTGTAALNLGAMTCSGVATNFHALPGVLTMGAMTCSGVVKREVPAVGAATIPVMTCSGVVTRTIPITSALTLGGMTCSGTGVFYTTHTAAGALTLGAMTVSGAGDYTTTHTGAGAVTLGAMTCSGTAVYYTTHTATSALTLGAMTCAGAGVYYTTHSGAGTLTTAAMTCSGAVAIYTKHTATAGISLPVMTLAGLVSRTIKGTAALSAAAMTASGSATRIVTTAPSLSLPAMTCSGVGVVYQFVTAVGAATLGAMTCSGVGIVYRLVTTVGAGALGAMSCSGTGVRTANVTGAATLGGMTCSAAGKRTIPAAGALTLGAATASGDCVGTRRAVGAMIMGAMRAIGQLEASSWDYQWYVVRDILEGDDTAPVRLAHVEAVKAPTRRTPA